MQVSRVLLEKLTGSQVACTSYLKCPLIGPNSHTQKLWVISNPPTNPFTKLFCRLDPHQALNSMTSAGSISA